MNTCKKKHVISIDFHFTQNAFLRREAMEPTAAHSSKRRPALFLFLFSGKQTVFFVFSSVKCVVCAYNICAMLLNLSGCIPTGFNPGFGKA